MPVELLPDLSDLTYPNFTSRIGDGVVFFRAVAPGILQPHPTNPNFRGARLIDVVHPSGPAYWLLSQVGGVSGLQAEIGWDYKDFHVFVQAKLGGKLGVGHAEMKLALPRLIGFERIPRDQHHALSGYLPPI